MRLQKQGGDNLPWLEAWEEISAHPDRLLARSLLDDAAARTLRRIGEAETVGWSWSAGKDSLGLAAVLEHAGLLDLPGMGRWTALEFPEFLDWSRENAPESVTVEVDEEINLQWLVGRPTLLFPERNVSRWFEFVQKRAQRQFARARGMDLLIGGWRRADGNYLGQAGREFEYVAPQGFTKFSPIAQWSHEDLLHVLAYSGTTMPPIYDYPRGFVLGTGPWPSRQRHPLGLLASWQEIYQVAPQLVLDAASAEIPSARTFLES